MNVHLYIDKLVLDGIAISSGQRPHLKATVERELTQLLTEQGVPHGWRTGGAVHCAPAKEIQLGRDNNPKTLGVQIAQAVYGKSSR